MGALGQSQPHGRDPAAAGTGPRRRRGGPIAPPAERLAPEVFETEIERLAAGGDGVGHHPDGRALFVPLTAAGDRVEVQVVEEHARFARAEIVSLVRPSPSRIRPPCPHFGSCGGCQWQHLSPETQLEAKRSILRDALVRIGGFDAQGEIAMVPSPAYGYRGRARVLVVGGRAGYRRRGSHDVEPVESCPVLAPPLEKALADLVGRARRDAPEGDSEGDPGEDSGEEWELALDADGSVRTTRLPSARSRAREARREEPVTLRVLGDEIGVSPGVFAQANVLLHEELATAVVESAGRGRSLVELFAGAGFFTIALARRFSRVWAVESQRDAVRDLVSNLRRAQVENVEVLRSRVERLRSTSIPEEPDVVVLDPPRTGLPRHAAGRLAALRARRIVYVSCDPATLSRDLAQLRDGGYALASVRGFDLFPQTAHVEALAVLDLEGR